MRRSPVSVVPIIVVIGIYMIFSLGPIVWMFLSSLKDRQELFAWPPTIFFEPSLDAYRATFGIGEASGSAASIGLGNALITSIIVSVGGTFFAVSFGTLAGYACSRFAFPGRDDFMFFALSTRMIPPVAVLVFYHSMFAQLGLIDTRLGLVLITTFINLGLATWIMKGFFDGVPREVENIAFVNGYSRLYAFWHLVLPMVKGGIAATAGFCFIFAWNEFTFSSVLATTKAQTLPVKISSAMGATGVEWAQICAAGVVLVIPVGVFFYLIRKYILTGMTFGVLGTPRT